MSSVKRGVCLFLMPLGLLLGCAAAGNAGEPLIKPGDRVVMLGGTLVESLQSEGACEVTVMLERPAWRVGFRNGAWAGDDVYGKARRVFGQPADGYDRLLQDVAVADPSVALVGYGFAEASDGVERAKKYEAGLRKLVGDLHSRGIRVVLMQPFPLPGVKTKGYGEAMNIVRQATSNVAEESQSPQIDPAAVVAEAGEDAFEDAGLRLSESGRQRLGRFLGLQLLGLPWSPRESAEANSLAEQLSAMVAEKNSLFFHRFRPMNETYLLLFRKHEQGNNAVEIPQFDPLIERAEERMWGLAAGSKR